MEYQYLVITGKQVGDDKLINRHSLEILRAITIYSKVIIPLEYRQADDKEILILQFNLEIPNAPKNNILGEETVAIVTFNDNKQLPKVYALRRDFPQGLPHTNIGTESLPVDLCIFEEPFSELKHKWSGSFFLNRIKEWLELTAKNELHQDDQPLEPFLVTNGILILDLKEIKNAPYVVKRNSSTYLLYTEKRLREERMENYHKIYGKLFISKEIEHGRLNIAPTNLKSLSDLLETVGIDVSSLLNSALNEISEQKITNEQRQDIFSNFGTIIFVELCLKRNDKGEVEDHHIYCFKIDTSIGEIGEKASVLGRMNNLYGKLISTQFNINLCEDVNVETLSIHQDFTYDSTKYLNENPILQDKEYALIGAGALGSQFLVNITRQGFGKWTVFDNDMILPHNLTRHTLNRYDIGNNKAKSISHYINNIIYPNQDIVKGLEYNMLDSNNEDKVKTAITYSTAIIDISTSVGVERYLSNEFKDKRKFSSFLNPEGTDLVLLSEDLDNKFPLDLLEHQYYSELLSNEELHDHLGYDDKSKVRYARGCRDITSRIPQDNVALFSGILSKALKNNLKSADSAIEIWQLLNDLSVRKYSFPIIKWTNMKVGSWSIYFSDSLLSKVIKYRQSKLPNETGGIILGGVDKYYQKIYITDTILSPSDSIEKPTLYIRGIEGVAEKLENISDITNGSIYYLGEWHSHPDNCSVNMSNDDKILFQELIEEGKYRGEPSLMLIVGQKDFNLYIGNDQLTN